MREIGTVFVLLLLLLLNANLNSNLWNTDKLVELERTKFADKPVVLVGTLNSLSQVDELQYEQNGDALPLITRVKYDQNFVVGAAHKIESDGPLSARKFLCKTGQDQGNPPHTVSLVFYEVVPCHACRWPPSTCLRFSLHGGTSRVRGAERGTIHYVDHE